MNYENFEHKEQLLRRRRSKLDRSICAIALAAERTSAVSALFTSLKEYRKVKTGSWSLRTNFSYDVRNRRRWILIEVNAQRW